MLLQCAAQADLRSAKEACINDKVKATEKYDTVSSCWLVSCLRSFPHLANNRCPDFNLMKDDYDLSFLDENEKKEFFSEGGKVENEKRKLKRQEKRKKINIREAKAERGTKTQRQ